MLKSLKTRKTHLINQEDQPPEKKIISDGDLLIKKLHEKQTCTQTNLQKELSRTNNFEKSTELIPFENCSGGSKTISDIKFLEKQSDRIALLKSAYISDESIYFYIDYERNGLEYVMKQHRFLTKEQVLQKISHLENCLAENQARTQSQNINSNTKELTRSQQEILTVKPNTIETRLLKFALENETSQSSSLPHPMDHIKDIEESLMDSVNGASHFLPVKRIQKKTRNLANQIKRYDSDPVTMPKAVHSSNRSLAKSSKWDITEKVEEAKPVCKENKIYSCKPQNYYTIKDGEIICLTSENSNVPTRCRDDNLKMQDEKSKLSLEEIRQLPRFKNYDCGTPSKILYLKNLANNATEEDVELIFSELKSNIVSCKVLKGKMRGQAFVEFTDIEAARGALDKVNGTYLKNKPVVMQFGKGESKLQNVENGD